MRTPVLLLSSIFLAACSSSSEHPAPATSDSGTVDVGVDAAPSLEEKRAACAFGAGAKVADTLGFTGEDRAKLPISHVIVMMKENRSFDHYFGKLPAEGRADVEGYPADYTNPDDKGMPVSPSHETNSCFPYDPGHQWAEMHAQWNGGKMDGFVKSAIATSVDKDDTTKVTTDGHFALTWRERSDLPFYFWLTDQYAMADRWHGAALAGTWANRLYMYAGHSHGVKNTGKDFVPADIKTIFHLLEAAGVSYGIYSEEDLVLDGALFTASIISGNPNIHKEKDFFDALEKGTLPQVSFIDAGMNTIDEHPPGDVQKGEAWTKKIYDAVTASPLWLKDGKGVALIWTYDESGGFADHVPPPKACVAAPDQGDFDRLGMRVPFVMISPFAKKKYVSHKTYDHTAISRFIEMIWDLPAMSARDANAENLLDFFDFAAIPNAKPGPAPAAGTGGCK